MDSFEFNKIAGAILAALLTAVAAGQIAGALIGAHELEENVYTVGGAEVEVAAVAKEAEAEDGGAGAAGSILLRLVAADPAAGEKVAKKCAACHSFDDGGPNKVGPNLWNIVGAQVARSEGFGYSSAVAELGGEWSYERLDQFLANPKGYAPGTKMSFSGIKNDSDRANLIAWLRQQSLTPATLPAEAATAAPETVTTDAAPAMEEAPAAAEAPSAQEATAETPAPAAEQPAAAEEEASTAAEAPQAEQPAMAETPAPAAAETPAAEAAPAESPTAETQQAAAAVGSPLAALFAGADRAAGAKLAMKCAACHNFAAGAGNKVGPPLWNIVGAQVAHTEDFKYSAALQDFGGTWTYDRLYTFLEKPRAAVPGTKMSFPGFKDPQQIADLLVWLGEQSDNPVAPPQ